MKKILLPTDGHKLSEEAVRVGLALARRIGAKAVIAMVHQPPLSEVELSSDKQVRAAELSLLTRWQLYGQEQSLGLSTHLAEGFDIAQELVALAKAEGCDLIVMGTHGREGLARFFLGSVAERVIRLSQLPVMLLPFKAASQGFAGFPRRTLVAVDGGEASTQALKQAVQLSRELGSELVLLHGIPDVSNAPGGYESMIYYSADPADMDAHFQLEGQAILKRAKESIAPLEAKTLLARGNRPADLILQTAQQEQCDLIVIGTHGYRGLDRLLLGSVAETVVHHASVPVLVVRAVSQPDRETAVVAGANSR